MKRHLFFFIALLAAHASWAQETHTVKPGDTLYDIARTYDTSVEALKALNELETNTIRVGQVLVLDAATEALPDSVVLIDTTLNIGRARAYTVREGETLYGIAADLGTKAYLLYALNGDVREPLEPGRRLIVPAETEGRRLYAVGEVAVFPYTSVGRTMAGGEAYDPTDFVVSHPELPMGTVLLLEHRTNGTATFARVADRGPADVELLMEVSRAVADVLELEGRELVQVWMVE